MWFKIFFSNSYAIFLRSRDKKRKIIKLLNAEFLGFVDSEFEENSDLSEINFDFNENKNENTVGKLKINDKQKKILKQFCEDNDLTLFTRNEKVNFVREKLRGYRKKCDVLLLKWAIHL